MIETIHYEMVECPCCRNKWLETMDNAHCIRVHGCCLRCRYQPSCVTVEYKIEPGLDVGSGYE